MKEPAVNGLEAMQIADKAWNSVEVKMIVNCFKKAGFLKVKISNYKDSKEKWHIRS